MLKLTVIVAVLAASVLALETANLTESKPLELSKDSSHEYAVNMLDCWDTDDNGNLNMTEIEVMVAGQQAGV